MVLVPDIDHSPDIGDWYGHTRKKNWLLEKKVLKNILECLLCKIAATYE